MRHRQCLSSRHVRHTARRLQPNLTLQKGAQEISLYGSAGAVTEMSVSAIARGPTGLTTVFTGAMAIRAGAIFSPCMHAQAFVRSVPHTSALLLCCIADRLVSMTCRGGLQHVHALQVLKCGFQEYTTAHLAGNSCVIGSNDDQIGRDGQTLGLHIHTCKAEHRDKNFCTSRHTNSANIKK